jgi:hypothetical protein
MTGVAIIVGSLFVSAAIYTLCDVGRRIAKAIEERK